MWTVDRVQKLVRPSVSGITREAKFCGDQGCIIHSAGKNGIFFTPVAVKTPLPDAMSQPWPVGDRVDAVAPAPEIDRPCRESPGELRAIREKPAPDDPPQPRGGSLTPTTSLR